MTRSDYYIYCYFHPETGEPCYIGKGRGGRWKAHLTSSKNPWLMSIITKFNKQIPYMKIHVGLTNKQANEYEKALIAAIGRDPHGPLVNMTDGGEGTQGWIPTEETKQKIADAARQRLADPVFREQHRRARIGRKASKETREKMSIARRSYKPSPETLAKIIAANRGQKRSPEIREKCAAARRGKKLSAEHIAAIVNANLGRKQSPELVAARIAKTATANRGRKASEETRAKMREAQKRRYERTAKLTITNTVDQPEAT